MKFIANMEDQKRYLIDTCVYQDKTQKINLERSYFTNLNKYQYFIKAYIKDDCQGFIYFYLNDLDNTSKFIGLYVKPEYRGNNIASLLIAQWISFCLNNNYDFLETNKAQRKPFLLYLLKTYGFELPNQKEYMTNKNVIDILRRDNDNGKYLFFRNPKEKIGFMQGKIVMEDNYQAILEFTPDFFYLDSIILSRPYILDNEFKATEKTNLVLKRHHL